MRAGFGASLAAALLALSGCSAPYLGHVTLGQARILLGRVSIEDRLEDPDVSEKEKAKLRFVLSVRQFATEEIGLTDSGSFKTVYDTNGGPAVWNISACADDAFVPFTWSFPVVGTIPYKGWFSRESAKDEQRELEASHHDVLVYGASAYSTLGWFADPLFTSMLDNTESYLANIICHELTHATVYIAGDSDFNETLATFVGNQGALDYFLKHGAADDHRIREAEDEKHDSVVFEKAIADLRAQLDAVYSQPISREQQLEKKDEILKAFRETYVREVRPKLRNGDYDGLVLRRKLNNAIILSLERYAGDLETFAALHRKLGGDLKATVAELKKIAQSDHPREALQAAAKN